ncbi:NmrA family NAD(P)-binding protein [Sphaerisporangium sp. TRM90804]|uniref:NmrA family NAD(P)-binding protein n=1 Tax=Sphaerisporangium sp. TRM90804 TaxID=3031113 RepID=UPI002447F398|nr:NmrA family NAD(P)-binding protein [Sphaerisporangium sp. TRM90804]MDH2426281.1 NAD(P)H-binding protein [Sphaerisporangium sp. TRM90804]
MILVTGATGRVGLRLARLLAGAGVPATAMVRAKTRAGRLPAGMPHLVAALEAPPPPDVLRRFDRVFLLSPTGPGQAAAEIVFADALAAAGHRPHVVKVAADGFQEPCCEVRFMRGHRRIAAHLARTGLPVTYLAPNLYMEDLLAAAATVRSRGALLAPAGDGAVGFVAAADVAAVAVRALSGEEEVGQVHLPTGPESLGLADVARRLSDACARPVRYAEVSPAEARRGMLAAGLSAWHADGMLELFDWVRRGGCATVTDDVPQATGREPVSMAEWLAGTRAAFTGRPPATSPLAWSPDTGRGSDVGRGPCGGRGPGAGGVDGMMGGWRSQGDQR